ncbi:MAG: HAMP domain-containing histidine kinase [Clostridiales bacterium]|nr:HAMP domain-containing histidine kinase [Clostridiales bacterium]
MKFSMKLLLWTMIIIAIAFGFSGFYFVNYVFETSLKREVDQALDESSILRFALETAALNIPAKYDVLPDHTVEQIASNLESGGHDEGRLLRLSGESRETLYASEGFEADAGLLFQTDESKRAYRVLHIGEKYYIQTAVTVNALDRVLYLETLKDVSAVFQERSLGFSVYRRVTILVLLLGTVIMHVISSWLTKPIRILTRATRRMAAGEYGYRARQVSQDELGQLTGAFNRMANALEENIRKLEEEIRDREEFVGAFAHELKTPLTAIIGYADMLRSRKLDEEKSFLAAQYIYTEGKRLEAMSFRLLDLIVTRHGQVEFQKTQAEQLFTYLNGMFRTKSGEQFDLVFDYEAGSIWAEANLIKTVMINLIDNACKASQPGGRIEISGRRVSGGYSFSVRDYGEGIPKEEQDKIMKAFYMVDKSRSRSRNGAGLGLALCTEILLLHNSKLTVESTLGEGTCMSFVLPEDVGEGENA